MFKLKNLAVLFCLSLPIILSGCNSDTSDLQKLKWLTGRWENEMGGIKTVEIWQQKPGNSFLVKGFMLENADTIFSEQITVAAKRGNIYYTVSIPDQNNGKPIAFKLTENTKNKAVFENPEHDFPQKISYWQTAADTVQISIEGVVKGKRKQEKYYLVKTGN